MDNEKKAPPSTEDVMKAFAGNKSIQNTIEALRMVSRYKGRDYKTVLTVTITDDGAAFGLSEGGTKAGFSEGVKEKIKDKPIRKEDIELGKELRKPIIDYAGSIYENVGDKILGEVADTVVFIAGPAIRHEIEIAVDKAWEENKPKKGTDG